MAGTLSITDADGVTTTTSLPARLLAELQRHTAHAATDMVLAGYTPVTVADVARALIELQLANISPADDDTTLSA
jgi:hypothetical protein